ncbi:MAM and LDL-receptor class A domain-containing protein 1-like, partial [Saccoglossus kowalevskii]
MRFFYHMYGMNIGKLNIYTRIYDNTNQGQTRVWQQKGENGALWDRAEIIFNINTDFQIVLEGVSGDSYYGNIALDDITFLSSCSLSTSGRLPTAPPTTPPPFPPSTTLHPACETGEFYCTADNSCLAPEFVCNFRSDCSDGEDETKRCMKSSCDFETDGCGWNGVFVESRRRSTKPKFVWDRQQGSTSQIGETRPSKDHTKKNGDGFYLLADNSPGTNLDTANITSPLIGQTGPSCHLEFWYHMGGRHVGSLIVMLQFETQTHVKYILSGVSGTEWKRGLAYLGTEQNFKVIIQAARGTSYYGDTCIDDLKFLDCAPPVLTGEPCSDDEYRCTNGFCIDKKKTCNFVDDCMDNSDEEHCANLVGRCDFETDFCGWRQEDGDEFDWSFYRGPQSDYYYYSGPPTDHTLRNENGQYAYIETKYPRKMAERARIASPSIKGSSVGCRISLWYHMSGNTIGSLAVLLRTSYSDGDSGLQVLKNITGEQGNFWWPLDLTINSGSDFKIVLEGMVGNTYYGDIAIDDVSFSGECLAGGHVTGEDMTTDSPPPTCMDDKRKLACKDGLGCYYSWERCNFYSDCADNSDESSCGTSCNFENGLCGWKNSVSDRFDWSIGKGSTTTQYSGPTSDHTYGNDQGHYVFIKTDGRNDKDKAHLISLPHQHSHEDCQLTFWYHMYSHYGDNYIGSLSVSIKYANHQSDQLWYKTGNQGDAWQKATVMIGRQEEFSIIFEGESGKLRYGDVAIDDLEFENCVDINYMRPCDTSIEFECELERRCLLLDRYCDYKPDCKDGSDEVDCAVKPGDCHFDKDSLYCDYEQKADDQFNWVAGIATPSEFSGPEYDHTEANATHGKSQFIYIDSTSQNLNQIARIATSTLFPASTNVCKLRFWYHMYTDVAGTMGSLRVYTESDVDNEQRLLMWERGHNMGKHWNYANIVLNNPHDFHVVFEGIVGQKGQSDIAIDDVTFTQSCRTPDNFTELEPGYCPRNQVFCPGDQICIFKSWLNDGNIDCPTDCFDEVQYRYNCDAATDPFIGDGSNETGNVGLIVGAVIGSLVAIKLVTFAVVFAVRRRKQKGSNFSFRSTGSDKARSGDFDKNPFSVDADAGAESCENKYSMDNPLYETDHATQA